jgi:hypothetical protein
MQPAKEVETVATWKGECWEKVEVQAEMWQVKAPERADTRHVLRSKPETLRSNARGCILVGRVALRTDIDKSSTAAEKLGSGENLPENRRPLSDNDIMFMYA